MECKNCELRQRHFLCDSCLQAHHRDFQLKIQHFAVERDDAVFKASKALEWTGLNRTRRAEVADLQRRIDDVQGALTILRKDNDAKRARLQSLREELATRRRNLSATKLSSITATNSNSGPLVREQQDLAALSANIARARSGLVQELVEVFNVVEVGGRPPVGGRPGTKGEWTIGDLILPVPGDIRRYPPDHINAVVTYTVHFLSLLTFYLGIKLPFEVLWGGGKIGVGIPSIGAIYGGEHGGWTKWNVKQPLHLSANPQTASLPPSPSASSDARLMSDSYILPSPEPQQTFTTAFAMLLYNVCYLAYTQSVDVPLAHAGDVLSNLWNVCCSAELGRRSHETQPILAAPTPPGFQLDFAQLMQAMTTTRPRAPLAKSRGVGNGKIARKDRALEVDEDGWDIIDEEAF
ncbi:hypothetical protein PM082_022811 [Marasmius tenuissimus]|nr:hypothetical protein PM082_024720 [Marasmius tenuissimus]KAJ8095904.1 hypothetical protein PM082_022811 [Marasmius tenuissimus]